MIKCGSFDPVKPRHAGRMPHARARSDWVESRRALASLFGRIFYNEPAFTSPENALDGDVVLATVWVVARTRWRNPCPSSKSRAAPRARPTHNTIDTSNTPA